MNKAQAWPLAALLCACLVGGTAAAQDPVLLDDDGLDDLGGGGGLMLDDDGLGDLGSPSAGGGLMLDDDGLGDLGSPSAGGGLMLDDDGLGDLGPPSADGGLMLDDEGLGDLGSPSAGGGLMLDDDGLGGETVGGGMMLDDDSIDLIASRTEGPEWDFSTRIGGEIATFATVFLDEVEDADENDIENDRFENWTHAQIDFEQTLGGPIILSTKLDGLFSTYGGAVQGVFTKPRSQRQQARFLDVNELYLRYEGEAASVTLGKEQLSIGVGELYSPTNNFGNVNGANPTNSIETGVWQGRFGYFTNTAEFQLHVMPVDTAPAGFPEGSRWQGGSADAEFSTLDTAEIVSDITDGAVEDADALEIKRVSRSTNFDQWSFLGRVEGFLPGIDYHGLVYRGKSPFPILENGRTSGGLDPTVFVDKVRPTVNAAGAGVAATFGALKVYTEPYIQFVEGGRDDHLLRYVVGATYRETELARQLGIIEINPVIEWADEVVLDAFETESDTVAGSVDARTARGNLLVGAKVQVTDDIDVNLFYDVNLEEGDQSVTSLVEYDWRGNISFDGKAGFYSGEDDTIYGRWKDNHFLELGVRYKF